jgi:hypothetical protein
MSAVLLKNNRVYFKKIASIKMGATIRELQPLFLVSITVKA